MRIKVVKKIRYFSLVAIVVLIGIVSAACGTKKNVSSGTTYKGLTVYPTKIKSVKTSDLDIRSIVEVTGTTNAPDGAKVMAQAPIGGRSKFSNLGSSEDTSYAKVKNHKFKLCISTGLVLLQNKNLDEHKYMKVKIFAVTGYNVKYSELKITKDLDQAVKQADIKPYKVKEDKNIEAFATGHVSQAYREKASKKFLINDAVKQLNDNFNGEVQFGYDENKKMFTFLPLTESVKENITEIKEGLDPEGWRQLTKVLDDLSSNIYDTLEVHEPISLIDPTDQSKILYTSLDGKATYNFMKQK